MELYTVQMAKWRECKKLDIEFKDITIMTGDSIFAPTWGMVKGHKSGRLTDHDYVNEYRELMTFSYRNHKEEWLDLLRSDKVAIACFCKAGSFCHRRLLVSMLDLVARTHQIEFKYIGELE